jgi:hypothetical protein
MGCRSRNTIGSRPLSKRFQNRISSWISGANNRRFLIWRAACVPVRGDGTRQAVICRGAD